MTFTDDDLMRLKGDCWWYLGPFFINERGVAYGRYDGIGAHRVSYEMHKGTIPSGLTIDHLCRNTVCINPDHLEAVTLKVNILRGESPVARHARSTHCLKGHPYDRVRKHGFRDCSICKSEYDIRYHAQHREERNEWNRAYYRRNRNRILRQKLRSSGKDEHD